MSPYVYQPYPKMLYHRTHTVTSPCHQVVYSLAEHRALDPAEWLDAPPPPDEAVASAPLLAADEPPAAAGPEKPKKGKRFFGA